MAWRGVRAKILAARGELRQAEALARSAVSFADQTDLLSLAGDAYLDLATVLTQGGRSEDAERAGRAALDLYGNKGNRAAVARAERLLERRETSPATLDHC